MSASAPGTSLRRKALGELNPHLDPLLQAVLRLQTAATHQNPAPRGAPDEGEGAGAFHAHGLVVPIGPDPYEQASLKDPARHVPSDKESNPSKLFLLRDVPLAAQRLANSLGKHLVVGHLPHSFGARHLAPAPCSGLSRLEKLQSALGPAAFALVLEEYVGALPVLRSNLLSQRADGLPGVLIPAQAEVAPVRRGDDRLDRCVVGVREA